MDDGSFSVGMTRRLLDGFSKAPVNLADISRGNRSGEIQAIGALRRTRPISGPEHTHWLVDVVIEPPGKCRLGVEEDLTILMGLHPPRGLCPHEVVLIGVAKESGISHHEDAVGGGRGLINV